MSRLAFYAILLLLIFAEIALGMIVYDFTDAAGYIQGFKGRCVFGAMGMIGFAIMILTSPNGPKITPRN